MNKLNPVYICNPEKNTKCLKTDCYLNPRRVCPDRPVCCSTRFPAFAMRDTDGTPIIDGSRNDFCLMVNEKYREQIDEISKGHIVLRINREGRPPH